MNSQPQDPDGSARTGARAADVDPWVDFLSEESNELDVLKTELLTIPPQTDSPREHEDGAAVPTSTAHRVVEPFPRHVPEPVSVVSLGSRVAPTTDGGSEAPPAAIDDLFLTEPPSEGTVSALSERQAAPPNRGLVLAHRQASSPGEVLSDASPSSLSLVPTPPAAVAAPRSEPSGHVGASIAIADVVARQVPVRWAEAVAVVEALCAVLIRDGAVGIPDTRHVQVTPTGEVTVAHGGKRDRELRALGRMLHALLATASPPLPLRLFVTASISAPRFETIELFADALSHYGVPNRAECIQALYRRALEAPAAPIVRRPVEPLSSPVLPDTADATRPQGRRKVVQLAVACGALACAAAVGAWFGATATSSSPASAATLAPAPPGRPSSAPAVDLGDSRDTWSIGRIDVPVPPVRQTRATPVVRELAASDTPLMPLMADPPRVAASPRERPASPSAVGSVADPTRAEGGGEAEAPSIVAAEDREDDTRDAPQGSRIYSSADTDVEPPVVLTAGALTLPPALPEEEPRPTIELLINERGVVESAQIRGRPRSLLDISPLSSYKYQRFRPAMKDGMPVPYRLYVR